MGSLAFAGPGAPSKPTSAPMVQGRLYSLPDGRYVIAVGPHGGIELASGQVITVPVWQDGDLDADCMPSKYRSYLSRARVLYRIRRLTSGCNVV